MLDLLKLRKDYDLSQAQLAKIANSSVRTVGNWERGGTSIDLATILKITQALNISVFKFFSIYLVVDETNDSSFVDLREMLDKVVALGENFAQMNEKLDYVYEYIAEKSATESMETLKKNIEKKRAEKLKN